MILLFLLPLCYGALSTERSEQKLYTNYVFLGITPANEDQYRFLFHLSKDANVDFWNGPYPANITSRVLVAPHHRRDVEATLSAKGIQYTILIDDVQAKIDEERRSLEEHSRSKRDDSSFFSAYHSLRKIVKYMKKLQQNHRKISSIHYIGKTYKKHKLRVLKIGNEKVPKKPAIWIDSLIHAREWISGSTSLYIATQLLTNYGSDPDVTKLIDSYDWYFMPVANPDGYEYTHKHERFWRKNLAPIPNSKYFGVDLNRNFDYMWNVTTRKTVRNPSSDIYQGPKAFSESESTAIAEFLSKLKESLLMYFSLHSFGPLWLIPYAHKESVPRNYDEMVKVANIGKSAMASYRNITPLIVTPAHELYSATGISTDWVAAVLDVSYSYTLELDSMIHQFETPIEDIKRIGEGIWRAIQAVTLHLL